MPVKKVAVAFFFVFKKPSKRQTCFFLTKTKKKKRERSCCFFQAKGKRFFSFRTTQKTDKQTKLYCIKYVIVCHQKNGKSSPPTYLSSLSSGNEHFQTSWPWWRHFEMVPYSFFKEFKGFQEFWVVNYTLYGSSVPIEALLGHETMIFYVLCKENMM